MFPNFLNFFKSSLTDWGKNDKVLWNIEEKCKTTEQKPEGESRSIIF